MQGNVIQALALTTVGNFCLRGGEAAGFWPDASVFRWTKQVEFVCARGGDVYEPAAADPLAWFDYLRSRGCRGLRLHNGPMRQAAKLGHIEERMLVGFVGGGPRWLIEAVGGERAELWEGFDRLGERSDPARKIWLTTYVMGSQTTPQDHADCDVSGAARELASVLTAIEPFAREIGAAAFAEIFAAARATLTEGDGEDFDFAALTTLSPQARRLLAAGAQAWVFGAMGSWNDFVPDEAHKSGYEKMSEALFQALQRAVVVVANSSYG